LGQNDVPGLTFYRGDDLSNTISRSKPLEPTPGSTTSIGVAVDTHEAVSGTETFTVVAQYEDEDETESDIDGSNLSVSPTNVEAGETVTVNATYRNNGDGWGTETARLTVDRTVVDRRTIALSSGEEETVSFERRMEWPGTYDVGIEGLGHQSVTVEGPQVEVSSATVDDDTITAGETATVRATVRNPSDRSLERTLELAVDGIVVDTRTVSIPANGERTVTFERRFAAAGTYEVGVSGVSAGTVTVEEPGPFSIQNRELGGGDDGGARAARDGRTVGPGGRREPAVGRSSLVAPLSNGAAEVELLWLRTNRASIDERPAQAGNRISTPPSRLVRSQALSLVPRASSSTRSRVRSSASPARHRGVTVSGAETRGLSSMRRLRDSPSELSRALYWRRNIV